MNQYLICGMKLQEVPLDFSVFSQSADQTLETRSNQNYFSKRKLDYAHIYC